MVNNTLFWIIFNVLVISNVCGTSCHLHGYVAECVNTNLTEIPEIPGYINVLIFVGNNLGTVTIDTFRNVENAGRIWKLSPAADRIVNISENAFQTFTSLDELDLNSNKINVNDLKYLLWNISVTHHLNVLQLNRMGIKTINEETFSLLDKTPASSLYLMHTGSPQIPYLD
ncbi:hypothetical protein ACF0H5_010057 [Mactra antiquata]